MYKHGIILATSFKYGKRIALDYIINDSFSSSIIDDVISYIKKECEYNVSLATHYILLDSKKWNDLQEYDSFFSTTEKINTKEEFADILKEDRYLSSIDVSKYILSKIKCTHLKLQKLLYFCYSDYLVENKERLFYDKLLAYKYGPVFENIYFNYKRITTEDREDNREKNLYKIENPAKSRILASENGIKKLISIEKTLNKYGKLTAWELVELTHKKGSPWYIAYNSNKGNYISDNLIIEKYLFFHN